MNGNRKPPETRAGGGKREDENNEKNHVQFMMSEIAKANCFTVRLLL
jgi:hypothetical protein